MQYNVLFFSRLDLLSALHHFLCQYFLNIWSNSVLVIEDIICNIEHCKLYFSLDLKNLIFAFHPHNCFCSTAFLSWFFFCKCNALSIFVRFVLLYFHFSSSSTQKLQKNSTQFASLFFLAKYFNCALQRLSRFPERYYVAVKLPI